MHAALTAPTEACLFNFLFFFFYIFSHSSAAGLRAQCGRVAVQSKPETKEDGGDSQIENISKWVKDNSSTAASLQRQLKLLAVCLI